MSPKNIPAAYPDDSGPAKQSRRLVSKAELLERDPRSYTTLWKLMVDGKFPRSVALGEKSRGWWDDELDEYYANLPRTKLKGDPE